MLRYRTIVFAAVALLLVPMAAVWSEPPITGDPGATYADLIGEEALVTVVLNNGARDYNLRITGVYESTIAFETQAGEATAYPISLIREIRVQQGRIDTSRLQKAEQTLSGDDKAIVDQAAARALEIFKQSNSAQQVKMVAAMVLAASTHQTNKDAAFYLGGLAQGNDVPTAMLASLYLWAAGEPPSDETIQEGFQSGNRDARAMAATLAGLMDRKQFIGDVRRLAHDPAVELYPAGAKAAGRLMDRQSLPELYDGIRSLRAEKAEAAVFALKKIDGSDVHQKMLDMLGTARGREWFRVLRVLYALGDSRAKELMLTDALRQPAYQRTAALILGKDSVPEGIDFLREYLTQQEDPNLENLQYRAQVGLVLFDAGDVQAKVILQNLLDTQPSEIYARGRTQDREYKEQTAAAVKRSVCAMIGDSLNRDLLSLLVPTMQSTEGDVALAACSAAMQIGNRDFGERLKAARE